MSTLFEHTLLADMPALGECLDSPQSVIDIGAGLRPATWVKAQNHLCVEPCQLYAKVLKENNYTVLQKTALQALPMTGYDLILMLDVIEHMERDVGLEVIDLALASDTKIILYTPYGFREQTTDQWGTGQTEWQTHRSGWSPEDFPWWDIIEGKEGFAAIR